MATFHVNLDYMVAPSLSISSCPGPVDPISIDQNISMLFNTIPPCPQAGEGNGGEKREEWRESPGFVIPRGVKVKVNVDLYSSRKNKKLFNISQNAHNIKELTNKHV